MDLADADGYGFENDAGQFKWEASLNSGWNELLEQTQSAEDDESFRLYNLVSKRKAGRKGLIRTLMIIIDDSRMSYMNDFPPTRAKWARSMLRPFIASFIEENPLGVIGIVSIRDGLAQPLCSITNDVQQLTKALEQKIEPGGDFSLQNALETCILPISNVGAHGSREILVLLSSFNSCDPGDIQATIAKLEKEKIRVCFLTMMGEYHIAKQIAKETKGLFIVAKDELDFHDQLKKFSNPLDDVFTSSKTTAKLALMGFPCQTPKGLCSCHFEVQESLYECPRCLSSICKIPSQCINCGLLLILGPDLAKSYHHLYPLNMTMASREGLFLCGACGMSCEKSSFQFDRLGSVYCTDCANYIHECLYVVPVV